MSSSSFLILLDKNPQIKYVDAVIVTLSGNEHVMTFSVADVERLIRQGHRLSTEVFLDKDNVKAMKNSSTQDNALTDNTLGIFEPVALIRIPFEQSYENDRAEILLSMTTRLPSELNPVEDFEFKDPREILKNILEPYREHNQQVMIAVDFTVTLHEKNETNDSLSADSASRHHQFNNNSLKFLKEVEGVCARQQIPILTPLELLDNNEIKITVNASNDIVSMADYVVIIKHIMEKVAKQYGIHTNIFDSNPNEQDRLSISLSLLDQHGDNMFNIQHGHSLINVAKLSLLDDALQSINLLRPCFHQDEKKIMSEIKKTIQKNIICQQTDSENAHIHHRISSLQSNPYLVFSTILAAVSFAIHSKGLHRTSIYKASFGEYIFNQM